MNILPAHSTLQDNINSLFGRLNSSLTKAGLPPIIFREDNEFCNWFIEDTNGWRLTEKKREEIITWLHGEHNTSQAQKIGELQAGIRQLKEEISGTRTMLKVNWNELRTAHAQDKKGKQDTTDTRERHRLYEEERERRDRKKALQGEVASREERIQQIEQEIGTSFPIPNLSERLQNVLLLSREESPEKRESTQKRNHFSWKFGGIAATAAAVVALLAMTNGKGDKAPEIFPKKGDISLSPTPPLLPLPIESSLRDPVEQLLRKEFIELLKKGSCTEKNWGDALSERANGKALGNSAVLEKIHHITFAIREDTGGFEYKIECSTPHGRQMFFGKTQTFSMKKIIEQSLQLPTTISEENLSGARKALEERIKKQFPEGNILGIASQGILVTLIENRGVVAFYIYLPYSDGGGIGVQRTCTLQPSPKDQIPIVGHQ